MPNPQPINITQRAMRIEAVQPSKRESKSPFYIVLLYILLEFGRPQDIIPGLGVLRLSMLTSLAIGFSLLFSGKVNIGNIQTKCFLAILALMVIHGPFAVNNYHALLTFQVMALTFIGYLGIICFVDSISKIRTLACLWLGVHLLLAIIGIIKGGVGVGGFFGDENDVAMELNMVIPFAFFGIFSASNTFKKSTYIGLLCAYIAAVLATLSRGGFIGLSAVGAFCWAQSSRKFLSAILVFLLVAFILVAAPEKYWKEIGSITSDQTMEQGTGGERLYTWGISWEMFLANPIMGVGQGNFQWVFPDYEQGRTFNTKSLGGRAAHSAYFTLLPELGLIGTSLFLGMLYFTRRDLKFVYKLCRLDNGKAGKGEQKSDELKKVYFLARAMECSFVGYLVSSIFVSTLYYPSCWIMMAFVVTLRNSALALDSDPLKAASAPIRNLSSRLGSVSYPGSRVR